MEPENTPVNTSEIKKTFFTVTPFSKYLAMLVFIVMPFVGFWLGYSYAPEKIIEVERATNGSSKSVENIRDATSTSKDSIASSTAKETFSRFELIAREDELVKKFGLVPDKATDGAPLYRARDKSIPNTLVPYHDRGISLLIPYNEGWGSPYYALTPFDLVDEILYFGLLDPCPFGCLESGAQKTGSILFTRPGLKAKIVDDFMRSYTSNFPACDEVKLSQVTGTYCRADGMGTHSFFVIEGSQYTYSITDRCAPYQAPGNDSIVKTDCERIGESIVVE